MDVTEVELDAILTESEDDKFLFGQIDCVLQAIKSVGFNCSQCPIQMSSLFTTGYYSLNLYTLDCDSTSSGRHNLHYGNINLT